jgi:hypothetical protein
MASWSRCNRYGTAPLQTIYINLDHVITAERVREYTLVKFSDGSERSWSRLSLWCARFSQLTSVAFSWRACSADPWMAHSPMQDSPEQ